MPRHGSRGLPIADARVLGLLAELGALLGAVAGALLTLLLPSDPS